jgi:uncharacterized protein (DUF2164 family)
MHPLKLPREQIDLLISRIQHYFQDERDESIGQLGAENLIHLMINEVGPYLYNQAIEDAAKLIADRSASLEEDLYALKRNPHAASK